MSTVLEEEPVTKEYEQPSDLEIATCTLQDALSGEAEYIFGVRGAFLELRMYIDQVLRAESPDSNEQELNKARDAIAFALQHELDFGASDGDKLDEVIAEVGNDKSSLTLLVAQRGELHAWLRKLGYTKSARTVMPEQRKRRKDGKLHAQQSSK